MLRIFKRRIRLSFQKSRRNLDRQCAELLLTDYFLPVVEPNFCIDVQTMIVFRVSLQ